MNIDEYSISLLTGGRTYEFTSEGKAQYRLGVEYSPLPGLSGYYNLAFGLIKEYEQDGEIKQDLDDRVVLNNGDRDKILATVIQTAFIFWSRHPDQLIYIEGSTVARTRVYRAIISNYGYQVADQIAFYGISNKQMVPFVPGDNYDGFVLVPL